jgi:hypothetical protein
MSHYKITALKMADTHVPSAEIYWMTKLFQWEPLCFWAFLIENKDRKILLNSGFPKDYSILREFWRTWAIAATGQEGHLPLLTEENWIVQALAKRQVHPEQIDEVIITPLTSYATGGMDQFPRARLWVSQHGWEDFTKPDPEIPQLPKDIIFPSHVLTWLQREAKERLHFLPDEKAECIPGIHSWFCGAHHRSSMAFVVKTAKGRVGLTDAIFKYRNYEENIPLGLSESIEEHHRLFARFRRETDLILPLYDPALVERHPNLIL